MAQEQTNLPFYNFMYPKLMMKDLFDLNLNEDIYIERAYNVWRDIGNIATATHAFQFIIPENGTVQLPCNAEFVEFVSYNHKWLDKHYHELVLISADWQVFNPNNFLFDSLITIPHLYQYGEQTSQLHPIGEYVPYELQGSKGNQQLFFSPDLVGREVVCCFRGILVDDDGNPLLHRKEAEAIAYQMAFLDTQKRAFMKDPTAINLLSYIKPEAARKMAAAKIPEYISQNQWNRLLSAQTRHDRKVFYSSYKLEQ